MLEKNIVPTLGILRVGANESDMAYENSAVKTANALGIHIEKYIMDADSDESDILDVLKVMNEDGNIHGILLFRPLPKSVDEDKIRNHIAPQKDVDGISDASVAGLFTGNRRGFPPCTAEAAIAILDYYGIGLEGKKVTVIGRSLVVGKPVSMMLLDRNAAVTIVPQQGFAGRSGPDMQEFRHHHLCCRQDKHGDSRPCKRQSDHHRCRDQLRPVRQNVR